MVTLLIQKNFIVLGLKDKSFMFGDLHSKYSTKMMLKFGLDNPLGARKDNSIDERERRLKREIKRLNKRMYQSLKEENFVEACQFFCQIICNKPPEWNEVSQIWSHAIQKKNAKYAKIILDLLLYKRVKKTFVEELRKEITETKVQPIKVPGEQENQNGDEGREEVPVEKPVLGGEKPGDRRSRCQSHLKYLYGFGRTRCSNPYDIVDFGNFRFVEPEGVTDPKGMLSGTLTDPETFNISIDELGNRLQVSKGQNSEFNLKNLFF